MGNTSDQTQYGRYKIVKLLGKGATASVYLAVDPMLGREVAVKVIHPQYTRQPGAIKRFEREAVVLARLIHPNIVTIFDMGEQDETFYIVIRLVSGGTLKERLLAARQANRPLPLPEVERIMVPICNAVDFIHKSGFIHRDLKPANIMFDDLDNPQIGDFGIVKTTDGENFTSAGAILGTPFYMSPEQLIGNIDYRSDIYSLGVILYEACAGTLPFKGNVIFDIIRGHTKEPPVPPDQVNLTLPPAVSRVILKALAKAPADRYQSAGELAQAFSNAIPKTQPPLQPPEHPPAQPQAQPPAHPAAQPLAQPPAHPAAQTPAHPAAQLQVQPPALPAAQTPAYPAAQPPAPQAQRRDTVAVGQLPPEQRQPEKSAYLRSLASGARYRLSPAVDNRIGRSKPERVVEVDLSAEKGSEFIHSFHAIIRHTPAGWQLETLAKTENPVYVNATKIPAGTHVPLSNGDELVFSKNKLIFEAG